MGSWAHFMDLGGRIATWRMGISGWCSFREEEEDDGCDVAAADDEKKDDDDDDANVNGDAGRNSSAIEDDDDEEISRTVTPGLKYPLRVPRQ